MEDAWKPEKKHPICGVAIWEGWKGEVKEQIKPERMAKGIGRNSVLKYDPRKSKKQ